MCHTTKEIEIDIIKIKLQFGYVYNRILILEINFRNRPAASSVSFTLNSFYRTQ